MKQDGEYFKEEIHFGLSAQEKKNN
jgi:hypothetical protein